MKRWMKFLSMVVALSVLALNAVAAPKSMTLTYEVKKNGQHFANVTETFSQDGKTYSIKSVTKGIGFYALLGKRTLISQGEITKAGLKPMHFESLRSKKASKSLISDFDWENYVLDMQVKGEKRQAVLLGGTQDLLSVMYQFMFVAPKGKALEQPFTSGKNIKVKQYQIGKTESLATKAGTFKVIGLTSQKEEDTKTIYIAQDKQNIPVKLVLLENGDKIEQTITQINIE